MPQRVVIHAMAAQQFQGMEGLRALADDIANVLAGGQMIRHGDAEDLDRGDAGNVRYLWRQADVQEAHACGLLIIIPTDLALLSLRLLLPIGIKVGSVFFSKYGIHSRTNERTSSGGTAWVHPPSTALAA